MFGHALCNINGIGEDVIGSSCSWGSEYWGFFIADEGAWGYSPVGYDGPGGCWNRDFSSWSGHYCAEEGDVIGLAHGTYGTEPAFYSFEQICENKLAVTDVKVYVDGDKSSADEDGGRIRNVKPGSVIEMEVEVKNLYTDEEDIDINNIMVEGVIEDIDDGSNLYDEADDFDLRPEKDKAVALKFNIPYDVEEDDYDLILSVEGRDANGVEHKLEIEYEVKVEKENEDIMIKSLDLSSPIIECGMATKVDVRIMNTGEEDVNGSIKISNEELALLQTKNFELGEGAERSFDFAIDTLNAKNGVYPIKIFLDFGFDTREETLELEIFGCGEEIKQTTGADYGPPQPASITGFANLQTTKQEKDFFETTSWQVIVLVFAIVGVAFGLLLIFNIK